MSAVDSSADPEEMIMALRRKRMLMMFLALAGIVVVLGCLFSATTAEELVAWAQDHLAAYKRPRIVEIRDTLPVGPTGKVLKAALRDAA